MRRLKTREQYLAVLANEPLTKTAHFAVHQSSIGLLSGSPEAWIGALVPKRWAKRAVMRNLIKRQIYCAANHYEALLPNLAHVVRLRAGFDVKKFKSASSERLKQEVNTEIGRLFHAVCNNHSI